MKSNILQPCAAAVGIFFAVVSAAEVREPPQSASEYRVEELQGPYQRTEEERDIQFVGGNIVRPVTYSFFSSNIPDSPAAHFQVNRPTYPQAEYQDSHRSFVGAESQEIAPRPPIQTDQTKPHSYVLPYGTLEQPIQNQIEDKSVPVVVRRTVRFPLNTVLPGNSITFDDQPYPGLLRAVNTFSDLTPARAPQEGLLVTHNTVSLPPSGDAKTTTSQTRITNSIFGGPFREFTETTQNTKGDKENILERTQHLRVHQGFGEDPSPSYASYKTGGKGYHREGGEENEDSHALKKGHKGGKAYKKDHDHHKTAKGHHDKENDSGLFEENVKEEKKYHEDEGFYGEHHKTEKGGKGKKYGEGGKHKKGHVTNGEHNILKKDEYIKNTKFYDEDHGSGEHEEHGEFYGKVEEEKGGKKEGERKETDYVKKEDTKKKHRDKGHVDEEHEGHHKSAGKEEHFEHEEEYGGKKGGHTFKNWGHNSGDKH